MIGVRNRLIPSRAAAPAGRLAFSPVDLTRDKVVMGEWTELLATAGLDNPFLSPQWCRECACALPTHERPLVLVARDDEGRLAAILPALSRRRRTPFGSVVEFAFLPEETSADHADIIAAPEWRDRAVEALTDFIVRSRHTAIIRFANVRQNSAAEQVVERLARDHGWQVIPHEPTPCPRLAISGTWDDYLASLAKHTRRNIRRERRRLETEYSAEIRELVPEELDAGLDWLEAAHARRWQGTAATVKWSWRVLRGCAREPSRACRVRLFGCLIGEQPIAILATLWSGGVAAAYRTAYDSAWSTLAPGRQLFACAIEAAFDEGASIFDFLRGESEHKSRWHAGSGFDEGWTAYRPGLRGWAAYLGAIGRGWATDLRDQLRRLARRAGPEPRESRP